MCNYIGFFMGMCRRVRVNIPINIDICIDIYIYMYLRIYRVGSLVSSMR